MMKPLLAALLMFFAAAGATAAPPAYDAMSGQQLFTRFCAACHGVRGRGDGAVAPSLRIEVPDLARLARRAGGKFPRDRIERIIDGRFTLAVHGSRAMPVWGEDLSRLYVGDPDGERATRLIITRLTDYLASLQQD